MQPNTTYVRANVAHVKDLVQQIGDSLSRVRAISTDLLEGRKRVGQQYMDQRIAIVHACEPKKLHNRSYIIDARAHAVSVMVNRECVSEAIANHVWGLFRDLWECQPHSRICVDPDPEQGVILQSTGFVWTRGKTAKKAHPYIIERIELLSTLIPEAASIHFQQINSDRPRVYVQLRDASDGLMLCTDIAAIQEMVRRIAQIGSNEEVGFMANRRDAWMSSLGIDESSLLIVLDVLASIIRFGPPDVCLL